MAPTKVPARTPVKTPAVEEIEEIEEIEDVRGPRSDEVAPLLPDGRAVTFVLDSSSSQDRRSQFLRRDDQGGEESSEEELDDELGEDEELTDEEDDGGLADAVGHLSQLFVTEEGEAVADVLRGIYDALEKQNKILYKGLQLLEAKHDPKPSKR